MMDNFTLNPEELLGAIPLRHSVRRYRDVPLEDEAVRFLARLAEWCNSRSGLNIQLVTNERRAYTGLLAYGKFSGVSNYFVMAGEKGPSLDEKVGYWGECLVLSAQATGLNTCWTGLSYRGVKGAYDIPRGQKLACMIALGYGLTQGSAHKIKTPAQVSNAGGDTPEWFLRGVEAALLAPTAVNQQKFAFIHTGRKEDGLDVVEARRGTSVIGYTHMDLGIAKLHFELGAGRGNFKWAVPGEELS